MNQVKNTNKQYSVVPANRDNPLTTFCKQNELSRLGEDQCYIQRRDYDSRRPFKLQTYHHHPYGSKVKATCYPGQFYSDGHVGGCNVDDESKVTRHPGYIMTNPNVHQELPTLPVNMPRIRGYFNSDIDSSLRPEATFNKKQCTLSSEKDFTKYTWDPFKFKNLCFNPQNSKYIIPEDTHNKCFKNARFWHRSGQPSRFDRQEKYVNACNRGGGYPQSLSMSSFGY